MFKPGDKYIHFTRFGGVNKGEVEFYNETTTIDPKNGVHYKYPFIRTKSGIVLYLNGSDGKIYKVSKEMTEEEIELWNKVESTNPKKYLQGENGMLTDIELESISKLITNQTEMNSEFYDIVNKDFN